MVLPAGQIPPDGDDNPPEALDDTLIEQRIRDLPVYPLGVTGKVRASLPGVQPKLLLWGVGGQWFTPDATHPSTHIIKPGIAELPGSVINEAFCLNLAAQAGLPAATTSVMQFGGTQVLVSERYDRHVDDTGATIRLQQEDACQALSVLTYLPKHKYQAYGGPNLAAVAAVLTNWGGSLEALLRYITFNVMVGNADLHGKNISFLHDGDRTISLAPMYDVMSTTHYDGAGGRNVDTELGLFIASQVDILDVTTDDLVAEAGRWGMRTAHATRTVSDLADAVLAAIDRTVDLFDGAVPAALVERIVARTMSFARR
jgi:serine/threonine-protein kinase HipA